jgi:subtilisin
MKKRKIFAGVVLSVSMALSFGSGTNAEERSTAKAKDVSSEKTYRVLIQGSQSEKTKVKKNMGTHRDFSNQGFTTDVSEKEYQKLLENKNIEVEKVPEFKIAATAIEKATSAPTTRVPWGIKAIYNNNSLTSTSGGSGIKVAVLDTGVLKTHASLSSNIEQCKDFTQTSSTVVNGSCADGNGHGTHVAGTVAGNGTGVYGVAPQSKVWAYKVLGDDGSGYSDDIAAAIRHAADQASSTGSKVIISMSLGSSSNNSLISSAVTYAYGKGVLIIAAAGNSGYSANTIGYPGALANVVAVAALENVQQNGTYRVANYSSRGNPSTDGDYVIGLKDVEISAPGSAVESTWHTGGYNTISGTSMATPHVSGLAAKIWASNTGYSHTQLRAELQRRAKLVDIKGGYGAATGDDYASGFGFARVQ